MDVFELLSAIIIRKLKWCQTFFSKFILGEKQKTGIRNCVNKFKNFYFEINIKNPNILSCYVYVTDQDLLGHLTNN